MKKHPTVPEIASVVDANPPLDGGWFNETYADPEQHAFTRAIELDGKGVVVRFTTGSTQTPEGYSPLIHIHNLSKWLIRLKRIFEDNYKVESISQDIPTSYLGLRMSAKDEELFQTIQCSECKRPLEYDPESSSGLCLSCENRVLSYQAARLTEVKEDLEEKLKDEQAGHQELAGHYTTMCKENQTLEVKLGAEKRKYQGLVTKYKLCNKNLEEKINQHKELASEYKRLEAEAAELVEENKALHLSMDPHAETNRKLEAEKNECIDQYHAVVKENISLTSQMQVLNHGLEKRSAALQKSVDTVEALQGTIDELKGRNSKLQQQLKLANSNFEAGEQQIADLEEQLKTAREANNIMEKNLVEENLRRKELEQEVDSRILELEEENGELRAQKKQERRKLRGVLFNFGKVFHMYEQGLTEYQENIRRLKELAKIGVEAETEAQELSEEPTGVLCKRCHGTIPVQDVMGDGVCAPCYYEMFPEFNVSTGPEEEDEGEEEEDEREERDEER